MDCFGIHKNSKNGQYWAYVSHFLYCSEAHGQVYLPELFGYVKDETSSEIDGLKTAFNKNFRNLLLFKVIKKQIWNCLRFLHILFSG